LPSTHPLLLLSVRDHQIVVIGGCSSSSGAALAGRRLHCGGHRTACLSEAEARRRSGAAFDRHVNASEAAEARRQAGRGDGDVNVISDGDVNVVREH